MYTDFVNKNYNANPEAASGGRTSTSQVNQTWSCLYEPWIKNIFQDDCSHPPKRNAAERNGSHMHRFDPKQNALPRVSYASHSSWSYGKRLLFENNVIENKWGAVIELVP